MPEPPQRTYDPKDLEDLRRKVAAAVRRTCPSHLVAQSDDIVQNVMIKLVRILEKSDGDRSFSSLYLEKTVSCALVDEIRRVCRRRETTVEDEQVMKRIVSGRADPERSSRAREIQEGILDCLERLIRPRRLAVGLYLNGCSVPEAARLLEWTHRKTESLVYRGMADLRRCLERKGLKP
jgi:RNA polymerase sigma-70 factor (ECF subfamily)